MNVDQINEAVWQEGWAIFDSYGSVSGPLQIQKFDDEDLWSDDCEVWKHVWQLAAAGSEVCQEALERIREGNLMEYRAIQHWCLHGEVLDQPKYDYREEG